MAPLMIAVLGPGGVGGFLAAALARAGEPVTVIGRESTVAAINDRGITVRSVRLGDFTARPAATTALDEPVSTLIVATKSLGLQDALSRIEAAPELVVPLLNGLDHMAVLRDRFGAGAVAAGCIRIEADRPAPAEIAQTSPFLRIDLAATDPAVHARLGPLAAQLEGAGVPAVIERSEAQVLWSKLVRLNALACTTSASGRQIGFIRSDPEWRAKLIACIEEATAAGRAEGATVDPAKTLAELDEAHEGLGSSMQRDIAAGRTPELDAIPGAVLRAAARHGLTAPTISALAAEIAERAGIPAPRVP
jgi:2-dehydropantoate 2-reductase